MRQRSARSSRSMDEITSSFFVGVFWIRAKSLWFGSRVLLACISRWLRFCVECGRADTSS